MSPAMAVLLGVLFAVVFGGAMAAVLLIKLRKINPITKPSPTTICISNGIQASESAVDQKMSELQEVHEQSLRGMKLDVRAAIANQSAAPTTPLDAKVEELKKMTRIK